MRKMNGGGEVRKDRSEGAPPWDFSVASTQFLTKMVLEAYEEEGKAITEKSVVHRENREQLIGDMVHLNSIFFPLAKLKILPLAVLLAVLLPVSGLMIKASLKERGKDPARTETRGKEILYKSSIAMTRFNALWDGGLAEVPLDLVREKKLVSFEYEREGNRIPLLVMMAPSGKFITAIGLSKPCGSKSFHVEGTEIVCDLCFTRWDPETLKGVHGECLDHPLDKVAHTLRAGRLVIRETDIPRMMHLGEERRS